MPQRPKITIQLVHLSGPLEGNIQHFSRFPVLIGRHPDCHARFGKNVSTLSRHHARIDCQGDRFRIVDTSTNGTYVNGKRIADVYLKDGDEITFSVDGPKASFLIQMESQSGSGPSSRDTARWESEADLTIGPGFEIPVVITNTPLLIQFEGAQQVFDSLPVTLGSNATCDCVISRDNIRGHHLQIFVNQGDFYVKDLTGMEMVTINGRPVNEQSVLARGATVSLGKQGPRFRLIGDGTLVEVLA